MVRDFKEKGFEVLAFPSNEYFNLEPESNASIKNFVESKYGTGLNLFSKVNINGPESHPVWQYLRRNSELWNEKEQKAKEVPWAWCKFLVDKNGKVVKYGMTNCPPISLKPLIEDLMKED